MNLRLNSVPTYHVVSIDYLPNELLVKIFSYLSDSDLNLNVSLISGSLEISTK